MSPSTSGVFVTGTDTEIGKTFVSTALVAAAHRAGLRVGVMKPVASGAVRTPAGLRNDDALALMSAVGETDYDATNPYCFEPPISPDLAAAEAGVTIDIEQIVSRVRVRAVQSDWQLIEGVGGWRAPLGGGSSIADLARAVGFPVVLVVGLRLGCLNHAALSADAIRRSGLCFAGWVGNRIDPAMQRPEDNLSTLESLLGAPPLAVFPHGADEKTRSGLGESLFGRLVVVPKNSQ